MKKDEKEIRGAFKRGTVKYLPATEAKKYREWAHTQAKDTVDLFKTNFYKRFKKNVKPGDYVRPCRENLGLSQAELGEKLGVSRAYICDIEKHRRSIGKDMIKQVATLFDAPIEFFF